MNILSKEKYLAQVKNAMLLRFRHKDIRFTLEDINSFFDSGVADQKTEEELCSALGNPKEFVHSLLHEQAQNKLTYISLAVHMISCLLLCVLIFSVFRYSSPLLSCITVITFSLFIWYSFGGHCLFQIRNDKAKHYKKYILYFIFSFLLIGTEQALIILLNHNIRIASPVILTTFYMSSLLTIVSIIILLITGYKLYKGHYLSYGVFTLAAGTIGSSLSYKYYLKHFDAPNTSYPICSLPFVAGLILAIFYYLYLLKKKDKKLWHHR